MDEQERAASTRRMWIVVGAAAGLVVLALGLLFLIGKGIGAPGEAFDREGIARFAGEGMQQVGHAGELAAAKVSAQGEQ